MLASNTSMKYAVPRSSYKFLTVMRFIYAGLDMIAELAPGKGIENQYKVPLLMGGGDDDTTIDIAI